MAGIRKDLYLSFAKEVLKKIGRHLSYQEIWDEGEKLRLNESLKRKGQTPHQTLAARLYVDSLKEESEFGRTGANPVRFHLKSAPPPQFAPSPQPHTSAKKSAETLAPNWYEEGDLHPVLSHFASANPKFGRGKNVKTKTIIHQKGMKSKGFSKWVFPDMVGIWLPNWNDALVEFGKKISGDLPLLFSFEIKKEIVPGNYREVFFQAVSNSSWANEGYLVAAEVSENDQMRAELRRLSTSFGVGIIRLDVDNPMDSEILYPATAKERLDWETMNKLCEESADFCGFLTRVREDFEAGQGETKYDDVQEEEKLKASFAEKRKKAEGHKPAKKKKKR